MSGFTYSIIFNLQNSSAVAQATTMTDRLDGSVNRLQVDINQTGRSMTDMGNRGTSAFSGLQSKVAGLLATVGAMRFGFDSLNTAANVEGMENAIRFAGGKEGQKNIDFLKRTVDEYGLSLESSMQGFKLWQGGIMGTSLEGEKGRQVFRSVAQATTAMALTAEDSNGVFLALSQIMGKGKVQAEELRGQIGERIPGAFAIAARAMNVTTAQLNKMLDDGKLMSEDFMPKFAAELSKTFGAGAQTQVNSARANFNAMTNEIFKLKNVIGTELMPTALTIIKDWLIPGVKWIGQNIEILGMLATSLGTVYLTTKAYGTIAAIAAIRTGTFTGTVWGLNAAMLANPMTWVVAALLALGVAAVYAWNKFEGFRGFMTGMWAVFKEFGSVLYDLVIVPLMGVGKALLGIITFNPALVKSGTQEAFSSLGRTYYEGGHRLGAAYSDGFKRGVKDFKSDQQLAYVKATTNEMMEGFGVKSKSFMLTGNPGDAKSDAITSAFTRKGGTAATNPLNDPKIKSGISSITEGGKQVKNITINLRNLIENLTIKAQNIREGSNEMRDIVTRELLQVLNTSNQVQ